MRGRAIWLLAAFIVLGGCTSVQLGRMGVGPDAPKMCYLPSGPPIMLQPSKCKVVAAKQQEEVAAKRAALKSKRDAVERQRRRAMAEQSAHLATLPPSRPVTVTASNGQTCTTNYSGDGPVDADTMAAIKKWCERQQRGKAILAITGPTEADMMAMSPGDRAKAFQALRCRDVREKLEVQRDMEAAGSTGYYNKDALLRLERQECGSNAAP